MLPQHRKGQWTKSKRTIFTDDIAKREKALKGPADYKDERKRKIPGVYDDKI